MKYFRYSKTETPVLVYKIFLAVQSCKGLAIDRYKNRWQDALDEAFFHILEHYDENKGELQNYTARIVNTIFISKNSREVNSDLVGEIQDKVSLLEENSFSDEYFVKDFKTEEDKEVKTCIKVLLPHFLEDYEFFKSGSRPKEVDSSYSELSIFPVNVVRRAIGVLNSYYDNIKSLVDIAKGCRMWTFSKDRYKKSLESGMIFAGQIGDIVKVKISGSLRKKFLYCLDIEDFLNKLYTMFYDDGTASTLVCGEVVYCTPIGSLVSSKERLYSVLEESIVGSILAMRHNLRVLHYDKGVKIIFTSLSNDETDIFLKFFNTGIRVPFKKLIMGILPT